MNDSYNVALSIMASSLTQDENDAVTVMSNLSALIYEELDNLNWAGFYRSREKGLILGPFQGKVACTYIEYGNGVCGYAAQNDLTTVVDNVHEFKTHIACDSASNSEIVIPIHSALGKVIGVLDIDSPVFSRFGEGDRLALEEVVKIFEAFLKEHDISVL